MFARLPTVCLSEGSSETKDLSATVRRPFRTRNYTRQSSSSLSDPAKAKSVRPWALMLSIVSTLRGVSIDHSVEGEFI